MSIFKRSGMTAHDVTALSAVLVQFMEVIGERLRDHDGEVEVLRQELTALREEVRQIKREPHVPFTQKLRARSQA